MPPKLARRYDLYLPLYFNNGRPIAHQKFAAVEKKLLQRFDGLTSQRREFPLKGIWQGEKHLYYDEVILITALDFRVRGSSRFIAALKTNLLEEFDQLEILITETLLRVF